MCELERERESESEKVNVAHNTRMRARARTHTHTTAQTVSTPSGDRHVKHFACAALARCVFAHMYMGFGLRVS